MFEAIVVVWLIILTGWTLLDRWVGMRRVALAKKREQERLEYFKGDNALENAMHSRRVRRRQDDLEWKNAWSKLSRKETYQRFRARKFKEDSDEALQKRQRNLANLAKAREAKRVKALRERAGAS